MKKNFVRLCLILLLTFVVNGSLKAETLELQCQRLSQTVSGSDFSLPNSPKNNRIFNLYADGFLNVMGSHGKPDLITGINQLARAFQQIEKPYKPYPALLLHPIICVSGFVNDPDRNDHRTTSNQSIKNWLMSEDKNELTTNFKHLEKQASTDPIAAYYVANAYLLGRGAPCDLIKALSWLEKSNDQNTLRYLQKIKFDTTKKCLRKEILENIPAY